MIDKELIKRNFSRYAEDYDQYCSVQDLCALKLIEKNKTDSMRSLLSEKAGEPLRILEIGCGTGNYTKLLRKRFPGTKIKALDISPAMVEIAKKKLGEEQLAFIVADAETINFKEQFDFISSNVTLQWIANLEKNLVKYGSLLAKDGIISFSMFGPRTFNELNSSLKEIYGESTSISSCNFVGKTPVKDILKRIFRRVSVEEEVLKEKYDSLLELLTKIKHTGARGQGTGSKDIWTLRSIDKVEKVYRAKFGKIVATYQILFYRAVK